jgi:hypothetical protein
MLSFCVRYASYIPHNEIRVVCRSSENVWDDIHPNSRDFIKSYLGQVPVAFTLKSSIGKFRVYLVTVFTTTPVHVSCLLSAVLAPKRHSYNLQTVLWMIRKFFVLIRILPGHFLLPLKKYVVIKFWTFFLDFL